MVAVEVLIAVVAALVALAAWGVFWRRWLVTPHAFDELVEVLTPDGATVVIGHLRAVGAQVALPPVVLVHGLAMNGRAMAFDRETSLAGSLAGAGRDVWSVELRGARLGAFDRRHARSDFDTYLEHDVPAAVEHVLAATGAAQVDWVGFSMGGMLAYAYAARAGRIRRLVTIGSPMRLWPVPLFRVFATLGIPSTRVLARVPTGLLLAMLAPLLPPFLPELVTPGLLARHYPRGRLGRALVTTMADVPSGVIAQFAGWLRSQGEVTDRDGAQRLQHLAGVTVPTLVIAGSRDRLARPASVRVGFEALGATDKRHLVVGPESGASDHYDHLDLVLAPRATEDVFPHVLGWLAQG